MQEGNWSVRDKLSLSLICADDRSNDFLPIGCAIICSKFKL
jgi:hypothetical protein